MAILVVDVEKVVGHTTEDAKMFCCSLTATPLEDYYKMMTDGDEAGNIDSSTTKIVNPTYLPDHLDRILVRRVDALATLRPRGLL